MSSLESDLVDAIRGAIVEQFPKAWMLKTHGNRYQASGTPDLLICVDGRFVALEVKHPYASETQQATVRRTTTAQRITLRKVANAGGWAAVVWSVDQALALVEKAVRRDDTGEAL